MPEGAGEKHSSVSVPFFSPYFQIYRYSSVFFFCVLHGKQSAAHAAPACALLDTRTHKTETPKRGLKTLLYLDPTNPYADTKQSQATNHTPELAAGR